MCVGVCLTDLISHQTVLQQQDQQSEGGRKQPWHWTHLEPHFQVPGTLRPVLLSHGKQWGKKWDLHNLFQQSKHKLTTEDSTQSHITQHTTLSHAQTLNGTNTLWKHFTPMNKLKGIVHPVDGPHWLPYYFSPTMDVTGGQQLFDYQHQNILFCVQHKKKNLYRFVTTGVNDERLFIFEVNYSFKNTNSTRVLNKHYPGWHSLV